MSLVIGQSFELYLDDDRYAVPTLHLIVAHDEPTAVDKARRLLEESLHHRGAELYRDDERVIGLGSFATRRLPEDVRTASARS